MFRPARRWHVYPQEWLMLLTFGFAVGVRLRLLSMPIDRDVGEYVVGGWLLLKGQVPYVAWQNMKMPGIYVCFALIQAVLGRSVEAIHVALIVVNLATGVLVYLLGRSLIGRRAAAAAGAVFVLATLSRSVQGVSANAEHFVLLPVVMGLLLLRMAQLRGGTWRLLAAGACLGIAVLIKQHAVMFAAAGVVWAWVGLPGRWRDAMWVVGGGVIVAGLTIVAFAAAGAFEAFWYWTIVYATHYVSQVDPWTMVRGRLLQTQLPQMGLWMMPIAFAAAVGLIALLMRGRWRSNGLPMWLIIAASMAAVCPGFFFRPHYFVMLLPAVSLLAGIGIAAAVSRWRRTRWSHAWLTMVLAAVVGLQIVVEYDFWLRQSPDDVARTLYFDNPFVQSPKIGAFIASRTHADDRLAVIGSEPQLYLYADRLPATTFPYVYPLVESHADARRLQKQFIAQIEQSAPSMIVYVEISTSWLYQPGAPDLIYPWMMRYLTAHYAYVGLVEIDHGQTRYHFDTKTLPMKPQARNLVYIFQRRDRVPFPPA